MKIVNGQRNNEEEKDEKRVEVRKEQGSTYFMNEPNLQKKI